MMGGEMFEKIQKQKVFSEREASSVMKTITQTVAYLHKNNVAHRDLKPSNILYADESGDPTTIRIVDFGFAKQIRHENGLLVTPSFTKSYVAPEVISLQQYDLSCDIWSLGCILFTMLTGTTPFGIGPEDSHEEIIKKINHGNLGLDGKISQYLSDGAKDLIKRLLTLDAKVRPTATQILTHTWIKNGHQLPEVNLAAMGTMNSNQMSRAVGGSISIINSRRSNGKAPGLQLQTPKSSGLFNRRMKKGKFPGALNL